MKRKNIRLLPPIALDERQRQQMYQIEHRGFWFAYFGILALLLLEILTNASGILIGCTTILLLALSIYTECCCIRRGLWDWRLKPNPKSNALMSMIGAVCIFVFTLLVYTKNGYFVNSPALMYLCALIAAFFTFILTFALLSVTAHICNKRKARLDEACEDDEEE